MIKIDIHSSSIDDALLLLKETINSADEEKLEFLQFDSNEPYAKQLDQAFEIEYNCKIIVEDVFGLTGHIEFLEEKYATAFVLRFGANDPPIKVCNDL